jgi:hypothetical protein
MLPLDQLPTIIQMTVKIMVLLGLSLYALYAGIMVRQEQLMDRVIDETFEPVLRILVILHFAGALGLIFLAFFTL